MLKGAQGEARATKQDKVAFEFTKKQIGSDYYATHDEDPLLNTTSASSGSFRKKKTAVGSKRERKNASNSLALADNDEEDIVTILE